MRKGILIFCVVITTFSLMAFGYLNWNITGTGQEESTRSTPLILDHDLLNSDNESSYPYLIYNVDSRFNTTITKEDLDRAKSIIDILPEKATNSIASYHSVEVVILHEDEAKSEIGNTEVLNNAQVNLLQSTDCSTDILITANYKYKNTTGSNLEDGQLTYYITVIPENEAEFTNGFDALIAYLIENIEEETAIIKQDKLQPGKVQFTVTKLGTIANVQLTSTCGYPTVDKALVDVITSIPGKWNPASNSKGEKVDQELVFFFGTEGC